jgi:hypothetical protein
MSTSTRSHRSTAYVKPISARGRSWKPEPITNQFRFVIRMAYACHERGVPYVLTWGRSKGIMAATIQVSGENIPVPKPLPKPPKPKPVQHWKPSVFDAVYRLEAYYDSSRNKSAPGFVVEHSCGLSLVHPSDSGELGVTAYGDNEDIREKWFIIHARSGLGFGVTTNFKRATLALLLAESCPVGWTQDVEALKTNPEFKKAGYTVQAEYAKGFDKDSAIRRLAELESAA